MFDDMSMMGITPFMPLEPKLAEAYVPYQEYKVSYNPQEALEKGTMFPELYRPYNKEDKYGRHEL